jgi:hypothetical protein
MTSFVGTGFAARGFALPVLVAATGAHHFQDKGSLLRKSL